MTSVTPFTVKSIDHVVFTCADVSKTIAFYELVGMHAVSFGGGRQALEFGNQKINLHQQGQEFEPKATSPKPGSQDLCFIIETPIQEAKSYLESVGVAIIEGPVDKVGARGPMLSIYVRDPDGNLVEFANYSEGKSRTST